jgi:dTDP-L-rhamnose 4-epimerase
MGTANLLDMLVNEEHSVKKVILASSMSVYGEGKYNCQNCNRAAYPRQRTDVQLKRAEWDHLCEECQSPLQPIATSEETPPRPQSIYALSKLQQEEMALLIGRTYGIPTIALRYFNVYGSRQALSNPYTGACAIFISRILHGRPPYLFEDGSQSRDFVHVRDVARANLRAIESNTAAYSAINIGTGRPTSILQLASTLVDMLDPALKPDISKTARKGDIRHCYPDVSRAKELLKFETKVELREGLKEVLSWAVSSKQAPADLFDKAYDELKHRNLA